MYVCVCLCSCIILCLVYAKSNKLFSVFLRNIISQVRRKSLDSCASLEKEWCIIDQSCLPYDEVFAVRISWTRTYQLGVTWWCEFFLCFFKYLLLHVPSSMNGLSHTRTETVRDCKRKKKHSYVIGSYFKLYDFFPDYFFLKGC